MEIVVQVRANTPVLPMGSVVSPTPLVADVTASKSEDMGTDVPPTPRWMEGCPWVVPV